MTYDEILRLAQSDPGRVDFREFRLAFTRTDGYAPYDVDALEEDDGLEEATRTSDWPRMLAGARSALERCYVRITPHIYGAMACAALGDAAGQCHHEECEKGLLASIIESGDGRTPETAFIVIGVWEEYDVLNALGLRAGRQALLAVGDRSVDRMTALSATDPEPFDLYFDVTIPTAAIRPRGEDELEGTAD